MWYDRVDICLSNVGYIRSEFEPCLFTKINKNVKDIIAFENSTNFANGCTNK